MRWPWQRPTEKRAGYTDAIVEAILSRSSGLPANPARLAAVELAAGLTGRALSTGLVTPGGPITVGVNRGFLATIGRRLIVPGEAVFVVEVMGGMVRFLEASHWDVRGVEAGPETWMYRCDLPSPDGVLSQTFSADQILHFRFSTDPNRPWRGLGPLDGGSATARTASAVEDALGDEAATSRGYVVPIPAQTETDPADVGAVDPLAAMSARLKSLSGKLSLVETTSAGFGSGRHDAPGGGAGNADWASKRLGASPPAALVDLRNQAAREVLQSCGVPLAMVETATGTGNRESYRQWLHTSVRPLGGIVAEELSRVLEVPVSFDFAELRASDDAPIARAIGSRASAFKTLRDGGVGLDDALRLSGLD